MTIMDHTLHTPEAHLHKTRRVSRFGLWVLLGGLGGFILWASLAPLDQGIAGSGTVTVAGERKTVQAAGQGSIRRILVREGQQVRAGQTLIELSTTRVQADYDLVLGQWINARSNEARLMAERINAGQIVWPADLLAYQTDARAREAMELQHGLFTTRRKELQSRVGILNNELQSLSAQLKGYDEIRQHYTDQVRLQEKELASLHELEKDGYVPKLKIYESQREASKYAAQLANGISDFNRTQQAINENRMKSLQVTQTFRSEVESQLGQVSTEVAALSERLKSLEVDVRNAAVTAPVSGRVMGLTVHTVGGVVGPGQKLMEIVPAEGDWIIKAQFEPLVADRLQPGLPVSIRFGSLRRANTPILTGKVVNVSADQMLDEVSKQPYFAVEVQADAQTDKSMQKAGLEIRPGMQAEVVVKTGERSLMAYLLQPLTERMAGAMIEE